VNTLMAPARPGFTLRAVSTQATPIHPAVRVGHVNLKVADLDRSLAFYRDALGFEVIADARAVGVDAVFLAAGDYHHHVAINTWESEGASPPPAGHTGLYHVAFVYPDRQELVKAVLRLRESGHVIEQYSDHGGSVAVYLDDPDGNGVELYYDRPRDAWRDADGRPVLRADHFPINQLINGG
jgi:catechol 2,3-dioxygenase